MRSLPSALTEAQQRAPLEYPKVRIQIRRRIGAIRRLDFDRVYEGEETAYFHCVTMPSDGSLNRFRVDPADNKLYRQRVRYPETAGADPAFGTNTIGPNYDGPYADWKHACKYTLAQGTSIKAIKAYTSAYADTAKAKAVIYADSAGAPAALLATSQEVTGIDTAPAWRTFTFATPVDLAAGTYWLGLILGDMRCRRYYDTGTSNQTCSAPDTYADGPSDPWGDTYSYDNYAVSIYAIAATFDTWTDTGETAKAIASYSYGSDVLLAFVDNASPYHVYVMSSDDNGDSWGSPVDTGAVSDTSGRVAIALKSDGTALVLYTRGAGLYARKRSSGVWGSESAAGYTLTSISGLAMLYVGDWNILITGVDSTSRDGVWSAIYGDGSSQAPNTWSILRDIMLRESTEPFQYTAPFIGYPDVFRSFFVERHTDPTTQDRVYFTYSPTTADYINNLWREPIPFDLETQYGIAIAHDAQNAWLTTPYGVWKSDYCPAAWDITDDVVEIFETDTPNRYRSRLKVILDNTAGKYAAFNKLGYEIAFGKGYQTSEGPLYSEGSSFSITGWRFVSPPWFPLRMIYPVGVIGTLEIHCEGFWDLAKRYKFRRQIEWVAGDKNIFQMLSCLITRLGFEFTSVSTSSIVVDHYPPLTIRAGTKAYTVLKKILSWCPDVLFQRGSTLYIKNLESDEAVDYDYNNSYGVSHVLYRGNYGTGAWDPNRAQVWGDTFMAEDFEFSQIQQVYDRLVSRITPEYPNVAKAADRAAAELRKGEVFAANTGWLQAPTHCGQEPFDVITITDNAAGVHDIKRRVLGLRTHWRKPFLFWQVFELGAP